MPASAAPPDRFMDLLLDAVCVVDDDGRFVFASAACESIFGYTPQEMIGRPMIDMVLPEDRERTLAAAAEIMSGQPKTGFENRYVRKDGEVVHIMWSARWSPADRLRIAVARDVTRRKHDEARQAATYAISEAVHGSGDLASLLRQVHQVIRGLLPADDVCVVMHDGDAGRLEVAYHHCGGVEAIPPLDAGEAALCMRVIAEGRTLLLEGADLVAHALPWPTGSRGAPACWIGVPLASSSEMLGVLVLKPGSGTSRYTEADRALLQFIALQVATAIERKQLYEHQSRLARYDELTGLPNRRLLGERLDAALQAARRAEGCLAVLYMDLDGLKRVNDSLGHAVGDQVLREAATRIAQCVRGSDTVARVGGDEFVVLLTAIREPGDAARIAEKIREAVGRPMPVAGAVLTVLPSTGIAHFPLHGHDAQALLKHADDAMYQAKRGRGRTVAA